jgi:hypothetical protein
MEKPRHLDPNPAFSSAEVSGERLLEPFTWLAMHAIDSLTIDGHRLVSVDKVQRQTGDTMHVVCSTEEHATHLFSFNPFDGGPVQHVLLDQDNPTT